MFYCNDCATKHNWPQSIFKSVGKCESCQIISFCNSVKAYLLPDYLAKEEIFMDAREIVMVVEKNMIEQDALLAEVMKEQGGLCYLTGFPLFENCDNCLVVNTGNVPLLFSMAGAKTLADSILAS